MTNYKTVLIPELSENILKNAKKELAPILGKTEVDELVQGVLSSISEILDRMFVANQITDPHLIFERGASFFEQTGQAKKPAIEIFQKNIPENINVETIAKIACYVKSKIMSIFYEDFLRALRSKLSSLSSEKKAPVPWNARNFMISKRQNLYDFLRTTVAPSNPNLYFEENFLRNISGSWLESYDKSSDLPDKKLLILHKAENKKRSTEPVAAHLREIGKYELVKTLPEQAHIKDRIENGSRIESEWARKDLQAVNSRLVVNIARKAMGNAVYNSQAIDLSDLIGEGHVGLNKAIEKYEPERGFKISTYASWWLKQSITRHIDERAEMIRVPVHLREKINRVCRARAELTNELGRIPKDEELAQRTGLTVEKLSKIISYISKTESLNQPYTDADEGEDMMASLTYQDDLLKTDDGESNDIATKLSNAMDQILEPKEARVLKMRFGIPGLHNCRHVSNKSLSEVEDLMSKINHESIAAYEINKIGDQFEIIADDEVMPLETLFEKTPEILENSHSTLNYKLTFQNATAARRTAAAIRDLKLPEPIQIVYSGSILTISCPYLNQVSMLQIRNNLSLFLNNANKLEIQSRTIININDEALSGKLDHLLNGSAPAGILKAEKTATFDIALSVIDKMCLEDIGDVHGLTRERIRQLEVRGMKKLRKKEFVKEDGTSITLHEMFGWDEENNLDVSE